MTHRTDFHIHTIRECLHLHNEDNLASLFSSLRTQETPSRSHLALIMLDILSSMVACPKCTFVWRNRISWNSRVNKVEKGEKER